MKFARSFLIFSYGLFTIAAQSLLFREFVTTFEGNDISVGVFFGSWLLWVGLGAMLVYKANGFAEKLLQNIEFCFLLFVPAFVLEFVLIVQARQLAGVESYALLSIRTILLLSMLVNAPVSIVTGMLFPVACRWFQEDRRLAVSRVYIIEAAGSFLGGLGVTILLAFGVSLARIFFLLTFVLSLSVFIVQLAQRLSGDKAAPKNKSTEGNRSSSVTACILSFLLPLSVCLCLAVGIDKSLAHYVRVIKWTKLFPEDTLLGSFQTAQAEYLYGNYRGQWVAVRQGSACEALPDEGTAGRIAAISLCQNPEAKRVLVIGSGLGLCREILRLPQIEQVTWAHSDNEYIQKINEVVPAEFVVSDRRFYRLAADVRSLLTEKKRYYDIVVLNLPEATSSVLNRYYTLEFYRQVKESLSPDGLLAVRITGGENIMGTELVSLGASTKLTLEKVFSQLVLTPGDETWFIASDSETLTGNPGTLKDRFATIKGGADIFSPQALLSVYLPDRAETALKNYSSADLPEGLLINRDSRPLTNLYSLLLAAKQSGAPITKFVKHLALTGPLAFFVPVLIFILLRVVYIWRTARHHILTESPKPISVSEVFVPSTFDSTSLVFSAGWLGIGAMIVLMYLYQTRFGSLYLHIGVVSSVFMAGLTVGGILISYLLSRELLIFNKSISSELRPAGVILLFTVVVVHVLTFAAVAFWPVEEWTHLIFLIAFVLCGVCTGCYFPLAARQLADCGIETGRAGSRLEASDHIGASAGAVVTGLLLVPVLGTRGTLFVFMLLILGPLFCYAFAKRAYLAGLLSDEQRMYRRGEALPSDTGAFGLRRLSYVLFGIGASAVLCSNLLDAAGARLRVSLPPYAAQVLAGGLNIEQCSAIIQGRSGGEQKVSYFKVYQTKEKDPNNPSPDLEGRKLTGYIFSSEELAPEVRGFGGRINLAIYVDAQGRLLSFHIIRSNETPVYLELLNQWLDTLRAPVSQEVGKAGSLSKYQIFQPKPFAGVHAVTGATVSSDAILSALERSGARFAGKVLGRALQPGVEDFGRAKYMPDTNAIYLISAFILTVIVIYGGGFWSRLAVLIFNLVVGGIILNAQYSSEQVATLLSMQRPSLGLTGVFLLVVGAPLLAVFFGNIYCGYICPFGAAQELLSYVVPERFKEPISKERMRKARFVKYVVLFILIVVFFVSRNRTTLAADPLIKVFARGFTLFTVGAGLVIAIALVGSVFYTRFWCRYLCPVGAFLSLFNSVVVLKRLVPPKKFGRCEFGLTAEDQLDCIYCDRCRYTASKAPKEALLPSAYTPIKLLSRYFITAVLILAIFVSAVSVSRFLKVMPRGDEYFTTVASSGGQPRDVDLKRIRTMIQQQKLSDHEAQYYKKAE